MKFKFVEIYEKDRDKIIGDGKMKQYKRMIGMIAALILFLNLQNRALGCDTWVAVKEATSIGATILAKNSDRTLFDCQPLFFHARQTWPKGSIIEMGRISIPQVETTYATMGSSPYWCWGYEEGINEFGVAIGNEGISSKILAASQEAYKAGNGPKLGPTGMDLLRLGLERGKTAREALDVICQLVETYGQFGSGLPTAGIEGSYENSYLIADFKEAWILEMVGIQWAARKIEKGVESISNKISIKTDWDLLSKNLKKYVQQRKWWLESSKEFDFEKVYGENFAAARMRNRRAQTRADRSCELLKGKYEEIDPEYMMKIARDRQTNPSLDLDVTASSCVVVLPGTKDQLPVFWWAPSVPSSSCYIPFFIHANSIPEIVSKTGTFGRKITPPSQVKEDNFSPESLWWLFRDLTDLVNLNREERNRIVRMEFDDLEKIFRAGVPNVIKDAAALRNAKKMDEAAGILEMFTAECVDKVVSKVNVLRKQFKQESFAATQMLAPYLGKYTANFQMFQNTIFEIKEKKHVLTLAIPGRGELDFDYPEDSGFWYYRLSRLLALTFEKNKNDRVTTMILHQTTPIPRTDDPSLVIPGDIPEDVISLLGSYELAAAGIKFKIFIKDKALAIETGNDEVLMLQPSKDNGIWGFGPGRTATVSFRRDEAGIVNILNLHKSFRIPKGLSAALPVESEIKSKGYSKGYI